MSEHAANIKFVQEVEKHPCLYNMELADYSRRDVTEAAWNEVGETVNMTTAECKVKWHNFRSSYTRYLRGIRRDPSGSAVKKKKWYMADSMNFLQPYVAPFSKMNNLPSNHQLEPVEDDSSVLCEEPDVQLTESTASSETYESSQSVKKNPRKKCRKTAAGIVAKPMVTYLQSFTKKNKLQEQEEEESILHFFKSLIPDIKKLDPRLQRNFKSQVMDLLNKMLDDEEEVLYNAGGIDSNWPNSHSKIVTKARTSLPQSLPQSVYND